MQNAIACDLNIVLHGPSWRVNEMSQNVIYGVVTLEEKQYEN